MLQDAGQGPTAGQVSQGSGTAGDQEGVVPGTWGRPQAGQDQALYEDQPSSSGLLLARCHPLSVSCTS